MLLLLAAFAMSGFPSPAHAEKVKRLTEQNITDFITETTKITEGHAFDMRADEINTYLEQHLNDEARFKTIVQYNVPGYPMQETAMSLDKQQFMEALQESAQSVDKYESAVNILNIRISSNGRSAIVETRSNEDIDLPVPLEDAKSEDVPVIGESTCTQNIMLSKSGIIQMLSAQCTTTIAFIDDNPL